MPYASVYPLVSSRAVARPFTYEVPPEVGKGAVVTVRFGGAKRRGVVVGLEESAPEGVKAALVGEVVDELPEPLCGLPTTTAPPRRGRSNLWRRPSGRLAVSGRSRQSGTRWAARPSLHG